jgi:Na+/glutamate symporter
MTPTAMLNLKEVIHNLMYKVKARLVRLLVGAALEKFETKLFD